MEASLVVWYLALGEWDRKTVASSVRAIELVIRGGFWIGWFVFEKQAQE